MLRDQFPDMRFLTFVGLILGSLTACSSVTSYLQRRKLPTGQRLPRDPHAGTQMLAGQLLLSAIIAGIWIVEGWSPGDVGVTTTPSPILSFFVGVACYGPIVVVYAWIAKLFGLESRLADVAFEATRCIWPRDRTQKRLMILASCVLNPVIEEVLFRGILVFNLGHVLRDVPTAIAIGLTFTMLAHAYQGLLALPSQLLFHSTAVLLLYSPFGLMACIGLHFAGDGWPTWTKSLRFKLWAERQRQSRRRHSQGAGSTSPAAVGREDEGSTAASG